MLNLIIGREIFEKLLKPLIEFVVISNFSQLLHSKYLRKLNLNSQNSLDAGIQDSSTSISIMYKIEEMPHEEENGDESNKHI